jgi:hypothetical protein
MVGKKLSHKEVRAQLKAAGLIGDGDQMHHINPRRGLPKDVKSWLNHPANLKVLPELKHQPLHRQWKGIPKAGLADRLWHGTNAWMKAAASGIGAEAAHLLPNSPANRNDDDRLDFPQGVP